MARFMDRRSSKDKKQDDQKPDVVVGPMMVETPARGPSAREVRRAIPGTRRMEQMLDEEHLRRPLTRQDYVNLRASEEFARRESQWWRKLWRWLTRMPQVTNVPARLADAHARSLVKIEKQLFEQEMAKLREVKKATKPEAP